MTLTLKPQTNKNKKIEEAISEVKKEELVKLTVLLSKKARSDFKMKVEQNDMNMNTVIRKYVSEYLSKT
jgi:hypothetical protein